MKVAQNWATFGQNGSLFRFPGHSGTFPGHFGKFPGHSRNFRATQIGPLSDNSGSLCKLSGPLWEFCLTQIGPLPVSWATLKIFRPHRLGYSSPMSLAFLVGRETRLCLIPCISGSHLCGPRTLWSRSRILEVVVMSYDTLEPCKQSVIAITAVIYLHMHHHKKGGLTLLLICPWRRYII